MNKEIPISKNLVNYLVRENAELREEVEALRNLLKGIGPACRSLCDYQEITIEQPRDVIECRKQLFVDAKLMYGGVEVVAKSRDGFKHAYYTDVPDLMTPEGKINIFTNLHERLIAALLKHYIDYE